MFNRHFGALFLPLPVDLLKKEFNHISKIKKNHIAKKSKPCAPYSRDTVNFLPVKHPPPIGTQTVNGVGMPFQGMRVPYEDMGVSFKGVQMLIQDL